MINKKINISALMVMILISGAISYFVREIILIKWSINTIKSTQAGHQILQQRANNETLKWMQLKEGLEKKFRQQNEASREKWLMMLKEIEKREAERRITP